MPGSVQEQYQVAMDALTPAERVARMVAMFNWTRETLARQILDEQGPMPFERLKWEVAKRLYCADPAALAMIERILEDVPT